VLVICGNCLAAQAFAHVTSRQHDRHRLVHLVSYFVFVVGIGVALKGTMKSSPTSSLRLDGLQIGEVSALRYRR